MNNKVIIQKIKLNAPLQGNKTGAELFITVDQNDIPMDKYWRRRLKEAAIDGCIEFVALEVEQEPSEFKSEKIKKGDK